MRNIALELMNKIDERKEYMNDLKCLLKTIMKSDDFKYSRLRACHDINQLIESVRVEIFVMQVKLAKIGIDYE